MYFKNITEIKFETKYNTTNFVANLKYHYSELEEDDNFQHGFREQYCGAMAQFVFPTEFLKSRMIVFKPEKIGKTYRNIIWENHTTFISTYPEFDVHHPMSFYQNEYEIHCKNKSSHYINSFYQKFYYLFKKE